MEEDQTSELNFSYVCPTCAVVSKDQAHLECDCRLPHHSQLMSSEESSQMSFEPSQLSQVPPLMTSQLFSEEGGQMSSQESVVISAGSSHGGRRDFNLWSTQETEFLIITVKNHFHRLTGKRERSAVWLDVARLVTEQKPGISINQVNTKWRNIKEKFKNFEDNKKQTGAPHMKEPQFYELLASFLLERPAINPVEVGDAGLGHLKKKQAGHYEPSSSLAVPSDHNPNDSPIPSTSFKVVPLRRNIQKSVKGKQGVVSFENLLVPIDAEETIHLPKRPHTGLGVQEQVDIDVDPWPTTSQEGSQDDISALVPLRHSIIESGVHRTKIPKPLISRVSTQVSRSRSSTPVSMMSRSSSPVVTFDQLRNEQITDAPASIPEETRVVNSPPLPDLQEQNRILETEDEDLLADLPAAPPQIQIPEVRGRRKTKRIRPPTRTAVISDYLKNLQAGSDKQVEQTSKLLEEIERHNKETERHHSTAEAILLNLVQNQQKLAETQEKGTNLIAAILERRDK